MPKNLENRWLEDLQMHWRASFSLLHFSLWIRLIDLEIQYGPVDRGQDRDLGVLGSSPSSTTGQLEKWLVWGPPCLACFDCTLFRTVSIHKLQWFKNNSVKDQRISSKGAYHSLTEISNLHAGYTDISQVLNLSVHTEFCINLAKLVQNPPNRELLRLWI